MTTGVIVAGGYARRFESRDKALVAVEDTAMIRRVADALGPLVDRLVVNCRRGQRSSIGIVLADLDAELRFAIDREPDGGPVAGLARGLELVDDDVTLALACDLPFVETDALAALLERLASERAADGPSGRDASPGAVVPVVDGHPNPLCAVYRTGALERAIEALDGPRDRAMGAMLDHLTVEAVAGDELPGGGDALRSVNTPASLDAVEGRH